MVFDIKVTRKGDLFHWQHTDPKLQVQTVTSGADHTSLLCTHNQGPTHHICNQYFLPHLQKQPHVEIVTFRQGSERKHTNYNMKIEKPRLGSTSGKIYQYMQILYSNPSIGCDILCGFSRYVVTGVFTKQSGIPIKRLLPRSQTFSGREQNPCVPHIFFKYQIILFAHSGL